MALTIYTLLLRLCYLILLYHSGNVFASQDNFFDHGGSFDDNSLPAGNDEAVNVALPSDVTFPYYGKPYSDLWIQTNGLLSFGKSIPDPQTGRYSNSFPLDPRVSENAVLIAPFWADVDTTSNRGSIGYHQSSSSSDADIQKATSVVRSNFPIHADFTATWVLVVTWDDVSFYEHNTASQNDPRNTFQTVLITDSQKSFVIFYYDVIEWTTGTTLGGNPDTGITQYPQHQAIIGFNAGDGLTGYTEGFTSLVERTELPGLSNIEEGGSFAFQVNHEITAAGCTSTMANFVTYPAFGSILGGEKIFLYGPCWYGTYVECQFWTRGDAPELLQTVNGTVDSPNSAYCIPDPFFVVGEVTIKTGGDDSASTGSYRIRNDFVYQSPGSVNLDRIAVTNAVSRVDPEGSDWHTAGNTLTLTWPEEVYGTNTLLDVHVLNYAEDDPRGPRWQEVYTAGEKVPNTGSFSFTRLRGLDNVTSENAFGTIRVRPAENRGVMLYSDIHPLGYLLEDTFQEDPYDWAADKCDEWDRQENLKTNFIDNLDSCPCTLDQALADTSRFVADLNCNLFNENECLLHANAKHCVLSIFPNENNAGSSCCYDEYGNLMYAGDFDADDNYVGSMSQRAHIAGSAPYGTAGTVPTLSHYKVDMMPFFYCCVMDANCLQYLHRRPTADCKNYESPKSAIVFGDPHFFTFDGANFTFNGQGDYTLLEYARSSDFKLVGRFGIIQAGYQAPFGSDEEIGATGLTSVVMVENSADAIMVSTSVINGIEIQRGEYNEDSAVTSKWEVVDFLGQTWLDFNGVGVSINNMEGYSRVTSVTVMFRGSRIGVNITRGTYDVSFLAATPILPPELMEEESLVGLLGNWNNDTSDDMKFQYSSGDRVDPEEDDPNVIYDFATTWASESQTLFETPYTTRQNYSDVRELTISNMNNNELNFLNNNCRDNWQCRFDYAVTRDEDLAQDTLDITEAYYWARNHSRKVYVCGYIPTPENGTKEYEWTDEETGQTMSTANNFFGTKIIFECSEGLTLEGSGTRVCQEKSGEYSGSGINRCVATDCGTLDTVENGAILIEYSPEGNPLATVTCDEGYEKTKGSSQHECNSGEWSGEKAVCEESGGSNAGLIAGCVIGGIFFVAIIVALVLVVVNMIKKRDTHKPKTANPVKYSEVESRDMGEDEGSKKSGSTKPTPAPRSVASEESKPMSDFV